MAKGTTTSDDKLIEKWIEPDPWKPWPDEARVKKYGMNVWAIIGYLGGEDGDIEDVARAYDVPAEVIEAAVAYYRRHKGIIDYRLGRNMA
jgi:uncharacterized protein (DUF433 family)